MRGHHENKKGRLSRNRQPFDMGLGLNRSDRRADRRLEGLVSGAEFGEFGLGLVDAVAHLNEARYLRGKGR